MFIRYGSSGGSDVRRLRRGHHELGEPRAFDVSTLFAIQLEAGPDAEPIIMIELKRVGVDLALKHLKQVASYAIDSGCEWILLTNSRDWRLYHVEFGQPPKTKLIEHWNLLTDDLTELAAKFELMSYKLVKKGELPAAKILNKLRFDRTSVKEYFKERKVNDK